MFSCAADVFVCVAPRIWFMCRWRIFECILCRVYPNFRSCESQKNSVLFQKSVECIQILFFNYTRLSSTEISEKYQGHEYLVL